MLEAIVRVHNNQRRLAGGKLNASSPVYLEDEPFLYLPTRIKFALCIPQGANTEGASTFKLTTSVIYCSSESSGSQTPANSSESSGQLNKLNLSESSSSQTPVNSYWQKFLTHPHGVIYAIYGPFSTYLKLFNS